MYHIIIYKKIIINYCDFTKCIISAIQQIWRMCKVDTPLAVILIIKIQISKHQNFKKTKRLKIYNTF